MSSQLSERRFLAPQRMNPMRPQLQIDVQTAFQQLLTARVLVVLIKDQRLFLMTEIDLFEG
jgi:hypothetical protein